MAITWTEVADSHANLGPSVQMQQSVASFGASDYPTGGYAVYPGSFGLGSMRSMIPCGVSSVSSGAPGSVVWAFEPPATAGPAASNPWRMKAGYITSAGFTESAANTDFSGGTLNVTAIGY